jgi:hypothetical protein
MDVLTFLGSLNPYGILNWAAAAYALYVARETKSISLLIIAAVNAFFGVLAVASSIA